MKLGITFGAYEYVHIGHIRLFQNAKKQCDHLIVCVSDDKYIEEKKGHAPAFGLQDRLDALQSIKEIDTLDVQSLNFGKKELIAKYGADVVFVGDDWTPETFTGENLGVPVVYLPRTQGVSSTKFRTLAIKFEDLTDGKKNKILGDLKQFESVMSDYDIYLQFGSLLGAIRERNLIGGDYDIDVCYMSHFHTMPEIVQEAKDLKVRLHKLGILDKHFDKSMQGVPPEQEVEPFGQFHVNGGSMIIDLFTSWIDENGDYWTCQWGNFGKADQFFPLSEGKLCDFTFKVPQNSELILARLYGEDWRTPRSDYPGNHVPGGRRNYLYC